MSYPIACPVDPFAFGRLPYPFVGESNANGRIVADPRSSGQRTAVFVTAGQSNAANVIDAIYTIANTGKVLNLSVFDGGTYRYQEPALGCNSQGPTGWGNWLGTFADNLITAGVYDRVILVPISIGSTSLDQWRKGGILNQGLIAAGRRVRALGLDVSAYMWIHGESAEGMTEAQYKAGLDEVIATPRDAGIVAPWMIGVSTYHGGVINIGANAALQHAPDYISVFPGANTDDLGGATYRQADFDVHFNATGRTVVAQRWASAITAYASSLPVNL